jgi:hypothetical protein
MYNVNFADIGLRGSSFTNSVVHPGTSVTVTDTGAGLQGYWTTGAEDALWHTSGFVEGKFYGNTASNASEAVGKFSVVKSDPELKDLPAAAIVGAFGVKK